MHNDNNQIIDYEALFKENVEEKNNQKLKTKSIMALLLYFLVMFAGGLFLIINFVSQRFIDPYDEKYSSPIVLNFVSNNDNALGLVNLDDYNDLAFDDEGINNEKYNIIVSKTYTYNNIDYLLILSNNQSANKSFVEIEANYQNILKGDVSTWPNSEDQINFIIYAGSPLYKYFDDNLNLINIDNNFIIDKSYQVDYANFLNFVTYLLITIPMFFIFRPELTYDFMVLKKDKEPILSIVLKGFSYMLIATIALGLITLLLQSLFGVSGDSVNQASVVGALKSNTAVLMVLSAVVFAPIVEELIFRKAIFSLIKSPILAIITSTITFGAIHVIGETSLISLLIQIIPYAGMGAFLSWYYYYKADKNIMTLILMHSASNLFSVVTILLS